MNNIFENAYFGKPYRTEKGDKVLYLSVYNCNSDAEGEQTLHRLVTEHDGVFLVHNDGTYAQNDISSDWNIVSEARYATSLNTHAVTPFRYSLLLNMEYSNTSLGTVNFILRQMKLKTRIKSFWRHNKKYPSMYFAITHAVMSISCLCILLVVPAIVNFGYSMMWLMLWKEERKSDYYKSLLQEFSVGSTSQGVASISRNASMLR